MALSSTILAALKSIEPESLNTSTLSFFEFLKYETEDLRNERIIIKKSIIDRYKNSTRHNQVLKTGQLKEEFNKFTELLDQLNLANDSDEILEDLKWEKIISICNILRKIESSDEKKVRWAILYLVANGKKEVQIEHIKNLLKNFKISNIDRTIQKIIKIETESGLDVSYDGKKIIIKTEEKVAEHYIADAIEEKSRRSPGEIEKEVLELLDEGSYSNQEISRILDIDEAVISRVMTKLRNQNKLVLSSFGNKGFRYYTTNCQNCPFGKTSSSCRKEAISSIVSAFKESYGIELTSKDFEEIESNQALLSIKRVTTMSKKDTKTNLESNMYQNFEKLLQMVVENSVKIDDYKSKKSRESITFSNLSRLPKIFQIGFKIGMEYEIQLLKNLISMTKDNKESSEALNKVIKESNKILQSLET